MCATLDGIHASLMDPQEPYSANPVIWDSKASLSLSVYRDDFVGELKKPSDKYKLTGIARGLDIEWMGHVVFTIRDCTGMLRSLKTKALYCPKATVKLLSTTSLLQEYDESISLTSNQLILSGNHGCEQPTNAVIMQIDPRNNLPTSQSVCYKSIDEIPNALNAAVKVLSHANQNITPVEKEWLKWHYRLGHMSFRKNPVFDEVRHTCQKPSSEVTPHCYRKTHHTSQMRSLPVCKGPTKISAKTANAFEGPRYPWRTEKEHSAT
jgi:hypothetical protein